MEHHSNIVPWQLVAEQTGAVLRAIPITDAGELDLDALPAAAQRRGPASSAWCTSPTCSARSTRSRSMTPTGARGRRRGAGGRRAVGAPPAGGRAGAWVRLLRLLRPQGVRAHRASGVLWGRAALLEAMPPWQGGGDMIDTVSLARAPPSRRCPPSSRRARRPSPRSIGLGAAIALRARRRVRRDRRTESGPARAAPPSGGRGSRACAWSARRARRPAVLSFTLEGVHPHDLGTVLDDDGVAIRAGHHCAQPLMRALRACPPRRGPRSRFYNTLDDDRRAGARVCTVRGRSSRDAAT